MIEDPLNADPEIEASFYSASFHVIIVEDDRGMAQWVEKNIVPIKEAFPYAKIQIESSWEGAKKAIFVEKHPDVVLLDLGLPGYQWQSIVGQVKEIEMHGPAVVIITGHAPDQVKELLEGVNVEILPKTPTLFGKGNIIRAIYRALNRKNIEDTEGRFKGMREKLRELDALGYGSSETQSP